MTDERPPQEPPAPPASTVDDQGEMPPASSTVDEQGGAEVDPVARAEQERDEYLDALRRERAEFENFRRRTSKERSDALDRGAELIVAGLLSVLDSFGLALEAAGKSDDEQLAKGVQMVHSQLLSALEQAGLSQVEGVGAVFDPTIHEAMLQVEAAEALGHEVDDAVVVEVLRPGYRFKGRVLRPASVKVAR